MTTKRICAIAGSLALSGASSTAVGQQAAPAFGGSDLVDPPTDGWPVNGGDWYNRRYSPLTEINRDNVANLRGVWRARLDGSGVGTQYSGEAEPIVYGGVIYIVTGADDVFALDVESGARLWEYASQLDPETDTVCCGWTSRGLGLGDGKIFLGRLDGQLVALDQRSGDVVWRVQAERWQDGFTITSAPLYYDGLVITGFAGAEYGVRGRIKAFDTDDGSLVWTFYTIPGPGEFGHDTWPADNDAWRYGGASAWNTPAVDPELGLIYFSTGNAGPDLNGSMRAGDNLFSASIVALDAATGEYRWHFQQVHHDIWDYDSANPVILFDIDIDGERRRGIGEASKTGWLYLLDRVSGEPLIGIDERPVPQEPRQATAATQPYPAGDAFVPQSIDIAPDGYKLVNGGRIFTPFWTDEIVPLKPSMWGGALWPPSSYNPEAGHYYICARDRIQPHRADPDPGTEPVPGEIYTLGLFTSPPIPDMGVFAAMDVRTNTIVWRKHWSDPCYSGSINTAGGLIFVGRNDGRLTALDSRDGSQLWEFQTGAGMNATAATFEHDGTQYVAAYSAGNTFAGSPRGDSVWLFSLDGTMTQVRPATAIMSFTDDADEPDRVNGRTVYAATCAFCHGETGEGIEDEGGGPSLASINAAGTVVQIVNEGRGEMPPFGGTLSLEQIRDVAAYVAEELAE